MSNKLLYVNMPPETRGMERIAYQFGNDALAPRIMGLLPLLDIASDKAESSNYFKVRDAVEEIESYGKHVILSDTTKGHIAAAKEWMDAVVRRLFADRAVLKAQDELKKGTPNEIPF